MFANQKGQITILLIIVIILFAIVITDGLSFLIEKSKSPVSIAEPGTYIPCEHPLTDDAIIRTTLQTTYHITLKGSTSPERDKLVYDTVCTLANYKYWKLIKDTAIVMDLTSGYSCYNGHAEPTGSASYYLNIGFCQYNQQGSIFLITHELGHVMVGRNPDLYDKFLSEVFGVTHPLDSVNCTNPRAGDRVQPGECFPDMLAFFFNYKDTAYSLDGGPPNWEKLRDYPQNYPIYYNFAKNNVFVPLVPAYTQTISPSPTTSVPAPTDIVFPEENPTPTETPPATGIH